MVDTTTHLYSLLQWYGHLRIPPLKFPWYWDCHLVHTVPTQICSSINDSILMYLGFEYVALLSNIVGVAFGSIFLIYYRLIRFYLLYIRMQLRIHHYCNFMICNGFWRFGHCGTWMGLSDWSTEILINFRAYADWRICSGHSEISDIIWMHLYIIECI